MSLHITRTNNNVIDLNKNKNEMSEKKTISKRTQNSECKADKQLSHTINEPRKLLQLQVSMQETAFYVGTRHMFGGCYAFHSYHQL